MNICCSGEVRMMPPSGLPPPSFFVKYLGNAAHSVLAQYGQHPDPTDLIADACLRCQSVRYAQRVAARKGSQVYFYVYDNPHNAAVHGAELPAVFGAVGEVSLEGTILRTSAKLVQRTQQIWTDFAKGQNISEVVPGWPQIQDGTSVHAMLIGEETSVLEISTARCAAWEAAEAIVGGWMTARMCNALMI